MSEFTNGFEYLINNLRGGVLPDDEMASVIENSKNDPLLFESAREARAAVYGTDVYIRGLIELTNFCKNNCYYCGIRRSCDIPRYRLTFRQVMDCCKTGYALGFRTFVLQGGEDSYFSDYKVCEIISEIKKKYPDCAVTLSLGEKSRESYKAFYNAGADRYLLRHETANSSHYSALHPRSMNITGRKRCLWDLKEIGFQVGSGFLVGSPFQTTAHIIEDLKFLRELQPDMIGIGPFIPHVGTPFGNYPAGSLQSCVRLIAILRIMFPYSLIPATTALATIAENGRTLGLLAGANVVMPNLTPVDVRELYQLYNGKKHTGTESAELLDSLKKEVSEAGFTIVTDIGHVRSKKTKPHTNSERIL